MYDIFEVNQLKKLAVKNQNYEFAVRLRDHEIYLMTDDGILFSGKEKIRVKQELRFKKLKRLL